eukprot:gnl/Hemi2/19694_TR6536_c0_g7_i2.p1 gnl/Hemi2/19694_TR6536_c0_g7~~gnl/Hemi2/19694_TR6536_c0_g7_i2.p1  ORF type:complete len:710 (-),score=286.64 gnl/Hemi2/19694_TR6536_c0_g7_i2:81-2123(-)
MGCTLSCCACCQFCCCCCCCAKDPLVLERHLRQSEQFIEAFRNLVCADTDRAHECRDALGCLEPSVLMSCAVDTNGNQRIIHQLDAYSHALLVSLELTEEGAQQAADPQQAHDAALLDEGGETEALLHQDVVVDPSAGPLISLRLNCIRDADEMYRQECAKNDIKKSGLFVKGMYCCEFGCSCLPTRTTAHQPLMFRNHIILCSAVEYHYLMWNGTEYLPAPDFHLLPGTTLFEKYVMCGELMCMHPFLEANRVLSCPAFPNHGGEADNVMLTFTFVYISCAKQTRVTFYELSEKHPEVNYADQGDTKEHPYQFILQARCALHMFGYTSDYFVLFENPFLLDTGKLLCCDTVLRAIEDDKLVDMKIHIFKRPSSKLPDPITHRVLEIRAPGFIYHTINCYQYDSAGHMMLHIEAFTSELNATRESSQFEMNTDFPVHDNNGDIWSLDIHLDQESTGKAPGPTSPLLLHRWPPHVNINITAPLVDSTIDFQTVHPDYMNNENFQYLYIVGTNRHYEVINGETQLVAISTLYKVDRLARTVVAMWQESSEHARSSEYEVLSCQLRDPVFVPYRRELTRNEDDGFLFVWCYYINMHHSSQSFCSMLAFNCSGTDIELGPVRWDRVEHASVTVGHDFTSAALGSVVPSASEGRADRCNLSGVPADPVRFLLPYAVHSETRTYIE